jgi:mannose-6-phosphate isomerase-like protein (cupin superfamily)
VGGLSVKLEVKRFDAPDGSRIFSKGKFELLTAGRMTVGRASYAPGWRWSEHVGPSVGEKSCQIEHVCMVVSGRAMIAMDDGTKVEVKPGDVFYVPPGHDSWVVGDEPYVSLHFLGSEHYAKTEG